MSSLGDALLREYAWELSDTPAPRPSTLHGVRRRLALEELVRDGFVLHTSAGPKLTASGVRRGTALIPTRHRIRDC
jgi:hypothetical protein